MLTEISNNGFTIISKSSNSPSGFENPLFFNTSIEAEKDGQHYTFHFHNELKVLARIRDSHIAARVAGNTAPTPQTLNESYVIAAFKRITDDLSEEQIAQAQSAEGCNVPLFEETTGTT